jgi:hypothetical protein
VIRGNTPAPSEVGFLFVQKTLWVPYCPQCEETPHNSSELLAKPFALGSQKMTGAPIFYILTLNFCGKAWMANIALRKR